MQPTGDQHLLKTLNRMALVRQLSAQPGLSRAALAETLMLTKSTVSGLVRELIDEGWLLEREVVATGELGRRPTPLFIDPGRLVLLGADIGVDGVQAIATSLTGDILGRLRSPLDARRDAASALAQLARMLLNLVVKGFYGTAGKRANHQTAQPGVVGRVHIEHHLLHVV